MHTLWQDVRHGLRSWRSQILLYSIAVSALALGIGANTTIFSVVQTVLMRPLPFQNADRLVNLFSIPPKKAGERYFISSSDYFDWRDRSRTLESFGGYWRTEVNLTDGDHDPERIPAVGVTPDVSSALGIQPMLGRAMTEAEGRPGGGDVALITYELWQRRYSGDPSMVGKAIGVSGRATTIVGILPPGIHFAGDAQVWTNFEPYRPRPTPRYMDVIARLRPGVTLAQAQAELDSIARAIAVEFPNTNAGWGAGVRTFRDDLVGPARPALVLLLISVSLLLLIACANVANLLLAHASARQREVALRAALGASRWRLARQFFTESLLLAIAGGGAGLLIAIAGVRAVRAFGPSSVPRISEVALNLPVLFYTAGVSVAAGILFGMAPMLRMRKPELISALKQSGRSATGAAGERRVRSLLVIAQVTLAVVLVNSSGLLIKSFARLASVDPGFRTENVLTADITLPRTRYAKIRDVPATFDRILDSARSLPGVKAAGTTTSLPLARDLDYRVPFSFTALPAPEHPEDQTAWHRMVSSGLFTALGARLIAGRDFTNRDTAEAPPVCVVNETLARLWTNGSPIGQKIRAVSGNFGPLGAILVRNPEIVGVVADIKYSGLGKSAEPAIYFSSLQAPFYAVSLVIRTDASFPPEGLIGALRYKVREIDPSLPLARVQTLTEHVAESVAQPRFQAVLLTAFSALALLLGSIGIYGLLSYGVVTRTREIGIRAALGGQPGDIQRLILGQGLRLVAVGLALGIGASLAAGRLIEKLLFEVKPVDIGTYGVVCALLAGVGILAGYLPARSASRIDPSIALRDS